MLFLSLTRHTLFDFMYLIKTINNIKLLLHQKGTEVKVGRFLIPIFCFADDVGLTISEKYKKFYMK